MNWNESGCKEFVSVVAGSPSLRVVCLLAAKLRHNPENEGKYDADQDGRSDRKIKGGVSAAMDDVAWEAAQAEGEFREK
jgi:hypothetical protein